MILLDWEQLAVDLESQARTVRTSESARMLKDRVEEAISIAENGCAPPDIMDRLDLLFMSLTEKSRENVCTNTKMSSLQQELQDAVNNIIMILAKPGPDKIYLPYP